MAVGREHWTIETRTDRAGDAVEVGGQLRIVACVFRVVKVQLKVVALHHVRRDRVCGPGAHHAQEHGGETKLVDKLGKRVKKADVRPAMRSAMVTANLGQKISSPK